MNSNSKVSSSTMRIAKSELGHDTINRFKRDFSHVLIKQKEEYEQEIVQLKKTHNEQICKLCNEIEKSSSLGVIRKSCDHGPNLSFRELLFSPLVAIFDGNPQ
ncbi:unnamed protein product [Rotaria sp. Silwood1]|nr:unnamed protein product [Rotaria sp. Silwood1]